MKKFICEEDFLSYISEIYTTKNISKVISKRTKKKNDNQYIKVPVSREKLYTVLSDIGCKIGVELGVGGGDNAESLIKKILSIEKLYLIDPWKHYPKIIYPYGWHKISQQQQDNRYKSVVERFKNDERIIVIRQESYFASESFDNNSIDFVYIDGNHNYEFVLADLTSWYHKVKKGGIILGHDFMGRPGVAKAVVDFSRLAKLEYIYVTSDKPWRTYMFLKDK